MYIGGLAGSLGTKVECWCRWANGRLIHHHSPSVPETHDGAGPSSKPDRLDYLHPSYLLRQVGGTYPGIHPVFGWLTMESTHHMCVRSTERIQSGIMARTLASVLFERRRQSGTQRPGHPPESKVPARTQRKWTVDHPDGCGHDAWQAGGSQKRYTQNPGH